MSQYFKIGKFAASHGLGGHLVLVHGLGKKSDFKGLEAIFLENSKDNFLPYFIESVAAKTDTESFVKLEGIHTKEAARRFTPKEVWLAADDFAKYAARQSPISMLGFQLIDGDKNLGEIVEVIEQPHQVLCAIMYHGNEALIPVHQHNLLKIDQDSRKVFVEVPEGLLDIYS